MSASILLAGTDLRCDWPSTRWRSGARLAKGQGIPVSPDPLLRLVQRQMYGRANFDLLRQRVLAAQAQKQRNAARRNGTQTFTRHTRCRLFCLRLTALITSLALIALRIIPARVLLHPNIISKMTNKLTVGSNNINQEGQRAH
jgi:hypothetical protein